MPDTGTVYRDDPPVDPGSLQEPVTPLSNLNIMIVAGSSRSAAQSTRIGKLIAERIPHVAGDADIDFLSLAETRLPLWDEGKAKGEDPWPDVWPPVSKRFSAADGFVFIIPEWGGMVPAQVKNLFHLCTEGELAHKPGLIVAVSSGTGGAYPIAELRASSYKNTFINWIPEQVIIRKVTDFQPGSGNEATPDWLTDRIDYKLRLLAAYAEATRPIRENIVDLKRFRTGM